MGISSYHNNNQLIHLGNENNGYQNLNELNIYTYDDKKENIDEIKKIEKKFVEFPEYNLKFYYENGNQNLEKNLTSLLNKIQNKFFTEKISNNIIIRLIDNDKNIENEKEWISCYLNRIHQIIRPIVVLGYKNKKIDEYINNHESSDNSDTLNINFEIVDYDKDSYEKIIEKIKYLYRYYNNIGDFYSIINESLGELPVNRKFQYFLE